MSFNKTQLGKDAKDAKKPTSKQQPKTVVPTMRKGGMTKKC